MKKILIFIGCLCVGMTLTAQEKPLELPLWANDAPNNNGLTGEEQQLENGRVSNISRPSITVYRPANPNGMAIIMCPGGGYVRLAMNHEGHDMAQWFNAQGITFAVLKYRMPNGHADVPLSDAEQAIRLVRQHAKEWQLNHNKIGIMGASAGGHLAATLATLYAGTDTRPDFQILLYPVINMKNGSPSLLGGNASEELKTKYSPDLQVNKDTPSAFITVSSDDRLAPHSILYYQALLEKTAPACLHAYPSGGHGWGFRDDFLYKRQWTEELEKWLRNF
ncbi:MAG: alpha/beta hydrolase [Bacteroidales bacterium]|nr:alpha/beta hydrolase [Bacteroidales bacterium]